MYKRDNTYTKNKKNVQKWESQIGFSVQKWNIRTNRSNDVCICVVLSYMFGGNLQLFYFIYTFYF